MSWPMFDFSAAPPYQQLMDFDGGANVIYIGWATPGVATSAAKWKIRKLGYTADSGGNLQVTSIKYASKDVGFNSIWDSRTSYVYG